MLKQSILMVCWTLASAHLLSAATYYVNSSTGSDSNAGTNSAAPWLTLYTSIPKLSPGDTLIATGTFSEAAGYGTYRMISASGSIGNPITILANNATLNLQTDSSDEAGVYWFTGDYLIIDGFGCTSTMAQGVDYGGFFGFYGNHCIARNLVVTNAYGSHAFAAGGGDHIWCFVNVGSQNTYSNIFFHEVNDADLFHMWGTNNLITHVVVSNCLNPYYHYVATNTDGITLLTNEIHADFVQTGLYATDSDTRSNTVECCLFINHDSDRTNSSVSGGIYSSAYGSRQTTTPAWWSHWSFRNNVFINWGQWFQMCNFTNHFYNNLFFNSGGATYNHIVYCGMNGGSGEGSLFYNNVFVNSSGIVIDGGVHVALSYNALDSSAYGKMQGSAGWSPAVSNLTVTAAQAAFVNATNYPYDFHPTSGSILRGNAFNLTADPSASTTDMEGKARPASGAWDMGPYQYAGAGPVTNAGSLPPPPGRSITLSAIQIAPLTIQAFGTVSGTNNLLYDFGDGKSSSNSNPIHAYANAGAYTITLTATNSSGRALMAQFGVIITP